MFRNLPVILVLPILILLPACDEKSPVSEDVTEHVRDIDDYISVQPNSGSSGGEPIMYSALVFSDQGILVGIDAPEDLQGGVHVKIDYSSSEYPGLFTKEAYAYQFDNNGDVARSVRATLDTLNKTIEFDLDSVGGAFVSPSPTASPAGDCSWQDELLLAALQQLERMIADFAANQASYTPAERCQKIHEIYLACIAGASFLPEFQFGARLFGPWLTGEGYRHQPVPIDNFRFHEDWYARWQGIAQTRATNEYTCNMSLGPFGAPLPRRIDPNVLESPTVGIGGYRVYTNGSYVAGCEPDGAVGASFEITAQAEDVVDFNTRGAFRYVNTICDVPVQIIIPDAWGIYLRDNCGIGRDYTIQSSEVTYIFGQQDYSTLQCDCESNDATVACFRAEPQCVLVGDRVWVDASCSQAGDDGALEYRWDWENNGSFDTPYSPNASYSHACSELGIKRIRLEVRDASGETDTYTSSILVGDNVACGDPSFVQMAPDWVNQLADLKPMDEEHPLVARIDVPAQGAIVRADVPIFGSACGSNFKRYSLQVGKGTHPIEWHSIATSSRPTATWNISALDQSLGRTIQGNLGNWDTGLKNYVYLPSYPTDHPVDLKGTYSVRLEVEGVSGAVVADTVVVAVGNVVPNALGGRLESSDGMVEVDVPAWAFDEAFRVITVEPQQSGGHSLPAGYERVGEVYEVAGVDLPLARPVDVKVIAPSGIIRPEEIVLLEWIPGVKKWSIIGESVRVENNGITVAARTSLQTTYVLARPSGIAGDTQPIVASIQRSSTQQVLASPVWATFENGFDGIYNRDTRNRVKLSIDPATAKDGSNCLKVETPHTGLGGCLTFLDQPFDLHEFSTVQLDYRVAPGAQFDFYVRVNNRWYTLRFTDQPNSYRGNRVNITDLGALENVIADGQWHTISFDLAERLRAKTAQSVVDELVLANWDVTGFMALEPGTSPAANMCFDNFRLLPLPSASRVQSQITIQDFEQGSFQNIFQEWDHTYRENGAEVLAELVAAPDIPTERSLRLAYSGTSESSFAGYIVPLPNLTVSGTTSLSFTLFTEYCPDLIVGLRDSHGIEGKVLVSSFAKRLSETDFLVQIPLVSFGSVSLQSIANISFSMRGECEKAAVTIDDVRFEPHCGDICIHSFESGDMTNSLKGTTRVFMSGGAAIACRTTSIEDRGVLCLAYGGNIGQFSIDNEPSYAGWATDLRGLRMDRTYVLEITVTSSSKADPPRVYLDDGGFRWGYTLPEYDNQSGAWKTYRIPLTYFAEAGVDITHLAELQFVAEWANSSGVFYIDDIRFIASNQELALFTR